MPIPDYQSLMLPVLRVLASGEAMPNSRIREQVAVSERLSPEEMRQRLQSRNKRFNTRIRFAILEMTHANLLEKVDRGVHRITEKGRELLSQNPQHIDCNLLEQISPNYAKCLAKWKNLPKDQDAGRRPTKSQDDSETPEETLDRVASQMNHDLEAEVLDRVRKAAPAFLEQVVVDLLIRMGYGGGDTSKGQVTGRSGDGGIDGKIQEDALGLDEVYVQAKKYDESRTVGEGDLRNFAGAIDAAGTTKGVFVTTAGFTKDAREYVARNPKRIVLIDGEKLAQLMVWHGVGVRTKEQYTIKRIDEDYFGPESE